MPGTTARRAARALGIPGTTRRVAGDEVALGVVDYRDGTMVGVRADDALIRVYGRDVWGWPVGVAVHIVRRGRPTRPAWRERLEVA